MIYSQACTPTRASSPPWRGNTGFILNFVDSAHTKMEGEDVAGMLAAALQHYQQSLAIYVMHKGKTDVDAIRMMCNIGLVYKVFDDAFDNRCACATLSSSCMHVI